MIRIKLGDWQSNRPMATGDMLHFGLGWTPPAAFEVGFVPLALWSYLPGDLTTSKSMPALHRHPIDAMLLGYWAARCWDCSAMLHAITLTLGGRTVPPDFQRGMARMRKVCAMLGLVL